MSVYIQEYKASVGVYTGVYGTVVSEHFKPLYRTSTRFLDPAGSQRDCLSLLACSLSLSLSLSLSQNVR